MSKKELNCTEVWLLTGTQHLYGDETLKQVSTNANEIVNYFNSNVELPIKIVCKNILTNSESIKAACLEANANADCIGIIAWMHTFSPAKMWIAGLVQLKKPFAHLHTQYHREIPWDKIDMDFMNLNQSAHGDREFGFISARLRQRRKVIVGHWRDDDVAYELDNWMRAALAYADGQKLKIARIGGMNMRDVAVTGGDRVEAQIQLGWSINGYGVSDLVEHIKAVSESDITTVIEQYESQYNLMPILQKNAERHQELRESARQEIGLQTFLNEGNFKAFTTTFEDLYGLEQLPGLACQRLMAAGYGFGAEGDWKTAALVRAMKVMSQGLSGGVSFMEDYTYHLVPNDELVLGAHMLEVCPSIAAERPALEIHPLGIGGKKDPCRLIFAAALGSAINVSLIDMGGRMRLIMGELDVVAPQHPMPKLPVAYALWRPRPDFKQGCQAWILSGGSHHASFAQALDPKIIEDYATMVGIELISINSETKIRELKQELFLNDMAYRLSR
ncbi:MAG: L-arabinose isomerase [Deltaproteobacteria bacterium]|nr:L-arabinose isomerase [Deltaproteobacteria bacterium]